MSILNGVVQFYNRDGDILYERRYHTLGGRGMMISQMCEKNSAISYYHILANYSGNKWLKEKKEPEKPFTRPPAIYSNTSKSLYGLTYE